MSEMVERVALAVFNEIHGRHDGRLRDPGEESRAAARAAIAAMRVPTEEMLAAAGYAVPVDVDNWLTSHDWPLMIDAALKDGS